MRQTILVLLALTVSGVFGAGCTHRDYGNGASVCVCNTKHCDDLPQVQKTTKGVVTSFQTSKDGDRFAEKKLHFSESPIKNSANITVTIDHKQKFQKVIGFGGAFTDAAGLNIAKLPKELQERLIKDYFGKNGIEYTVGRVPIGGSDFSTRPYSYVDHPKDETLSTFALQEEDYKYKIPYMQMAIKESSHKVRYFGSPWSSPAWMKTNNQINHGGFLKGHPGGKYYKLFAEYFVKFLKEYEKHNLTMWGLTVENEPGAGFNPKYKWNSLGFNASLERDFIKMDLGPELHKHGYTKDKLKLMTYDDQLTNFYAFNKVILSDKEAAKYVSGIAFHWYQTTAQNRININELFKVFKGYFALATEACEEWHGKAHHVSLGNWATFDRYADDIIKDLNHLASGWVDWNIALNLEGGPNWVGNFVDAPIIINSTSQEYYKQPFFYALGHFSKFLVPDSIRIHHKSETKDNQHLEVVVFERPDNSTVLTLLNTNSHAVDMHVHDPEQGYLQVHVKPHSLESLIWFN